MKKKKKPLTCINGVKGAISLVMAVLMTPFLTIALLLVETGRYNSAVSLLDEALGLSATSVLADYDPYLQNRWGLLATRQDVDPTKDFTGFLEANTASLGKTYALQDTQAEGLFPLADVDILKQQILEFGKLRAPTKLATELISTFTDMLDFKEEFQKKIKLFKSITDSVSAGTDAVGSAVDLVQNHEALEASAKALDELKIEYDGDYATFETTVNGLLDQLLELDRRYRSWQAAKGELAVLQGEMDALKAEDNEYQIIIDGIKNDKGEYVIAPRALTEEEQTERDKLAEEIEDKQKEVDLKAGEVRDKKNYYNTKLSQIPTYRDSAASAQSDYADVLGRISAEMKNFAELTGDIQKTLGELNSQIFTAASKITQATNNLMQVKTEWEKKQKEYKAAKVELETLNEKGVEITDEEYVNALKKKAEAEKAYNEVDAKKVQYETEVAICDSTNKCIKEMYDELTTAYSDFDAATLGALATSFEGLQTKVNGLNMNSITSSATRISISGYKDLEVAGYIDPDEIDDYIDEQEKEMQKGSLKAIADAFVTLYNSIMGVSIFFEDDLNAVIDLEYFEGEMGGLPGGTNDEGDVKAIISSLGNILVTWGELRVNLGTLRLGKALESCWNLLKSIWGLMVSIYNFACTILEIMTELLSYERWILCTYCAYNLTCRADFNTATEEMSMSALTGYSVGTDSFPETENWPSIPVIGELVQLVNAITTCAAGTGADKSFDGAEVEYVIYGSKSEIANQLYVFCLLYVVNAIICVGPISGDAEVQALAASTTIGYPAVMTLYYLLEPLVRSALMANGREQDLFPKDVYLSPTGVPKLITELVSFCKFTNNKTTEIKSKVVKAFKPKNSTDEEYEKVYQANLAKYEESLDAKEAKEQKEATKLDAAAKKLRKSLKFSYKDFCMVILFLTVRQERMVERLCNIIQMETLCYYEQQEVEYTFDLRKSFTYLHVSTEADINQIMPDLLDSELFKVKRELYRGY